MSDIHSCSYYCTRPACVLQQRDELRDKLYKQQPNPLIAVVTESGDFSATVDWVLNPLPVNTELYARRPQFSRPSKLTKPAPVVDKEQAEPVAEPLVCVCGDPTSLGIVHRTDGPCFAPPPQEPVVEPHKPATSPDNGQFMSQADNGNPSY